MLKIECKNFVVWGTNLRSTIGQVRFTKQVSNMIKLPLYIYGVVIGVIHSDGWLSIPTPTSKSARLGFKQSLARFDYTWFVFNHLSHYCSSYPRLTTGVRKEKRFFGVEFATRALPCFTELHSLFYVNKIKVIPQNIYDILTPVALAHLIMGDGAVHREKKLRICSDSFNVSDVIRLMNV